MRHFIHSNSSLRFLLLCLCIGGLELATTVAQVHGQGQSQNLEHSYTLFHQGAERTIKLPCRLMDLENWPDIKLYGETHGEYWAKLEGDLFKEQAKRGDFYLGLEGLFYGEVPPEAMGNSQARIFGIDDAFPYGLGLLIHRQVFLPLLKSKEDSALLSQELKLFKKHMQDIPYLQEVYSRLSIEKPNLSMTTLEEYGRFLQEMTRAYVDLSKTDDYRVPYRVPPTIDLALDVEHEKVIVELNGGWRNIFFLENILRTYCQASLEKKELRVIVGELHLKGLTELFEKYFEDLPLKTFSLGASLGTSKRNPPPLCRP